MKVTLVVPGRWHAFDLAKELEEGGSLYRVVTNYPRSRTRRWGIPDEKVESLPSSLLLTKLCWKLGGERLAMVLNYRINNVFAQKAAKRIGSPDLLHAWSSAAEPALRRAIKSRIPTVLERSSSHMLEQCRILRAAYAELNLKWQETPRLAVARELREYELVDRIFVPSLFVERSFTVRGVPARRLFRNGFGVDVAKFAPGEKRDEPFRIVYAGSLSVRKGLHYLALAFREANIPKSELLLVGGVLSETDRLLGVPDPRIRRIGHVPQSDLPALYKTGSVFAIASLEEGQALVQAQALACGLPLVCSTNSGGEDFLSLVGSGVSRGGSLKEFPAGYVVATGDATAMAMVFRELASEPSRLSAKREAARRLATCDLSWRRYAHANLEEYERIISARRQTIAT